MADDNVIGGGAGDHGAHDGAHGHKHEGADGAHDGGSHHKSAKEQANAMWGEINKGVAKDERENLKGEVAASDAEPVNPFADAEVADGSFDGPINPFADAPLPVSEEEKTPEDKHHAEEIDSQDAEESPAPDELHPKHKEKKEEEVVEAEVVNRPFDPGSPAMDIEEAEEKAEFWQVLQQAGVTKRSIVTGLVVLGVAVLFLFSFLFGWWDIFSFSNDGGDQDQPVQEEDEPSDEPITDDRNEDGGDNFYSVISSYIVDMEYRPLDDVSPIGQWGTFVPLDVAFEVGLDIRKQQAATFVEYTDLLRKLENAFATDIYALLDLAVEDRRGALEEHIKELEKLIVAGQNAVLDLDGELVSLNNEYNIVLVERDNLEANFFTQMDLMQGEAAYQNLLTFTELSKETVGIRAQFNGRSILQEMLNDVLSVLIPRLEDIKANREALVRGIRVFDIPGSNIDSIVPVELNP